MSVLSLLALVSSAESFFDICPLGHCGFPGLHMLLSVVPGY